MKVKSLLFWLATSCFVASLAFSVSYTPVPDEAAKKWKYLPQPSKVPLMEYEAELYQWLRDRKYAKMGWAVDKRVRDCGPYVKCNYYGVHPAVRVFYSPEVIEWLENDRLGKIKDGAIIVKEMYTPPAARWEDKTEEELANEIENWTVMIKDSEGSYDGWFWGAYYYDRKNGEALKVDSLDKYPYEVPESGFGTYCSRCHASAEKEHTFSSKANIKGFPGDPIVYRVDESWRNTCKYCNVDCGTAGEKTVDISEHGLVLGRYDFFGNFLGHQYAGLDSLGHHEMPGFLKQFPEMKPVLPHEVVSLPPVTYDHVVVPPGGPVQFITSNQCMPCHSGQTGWTYEGPNMYIPHSNKIKAGLRSSENVEGMDVSPYGEWKWSMMGLAGRDPIFFAQIESELKLQPKHSDTIQNTCFRCHGVMGQRQITLDKGERFYEEYVYAKGNDPHAKYGALARDGISCMTCHQITDDGLKLEEVETGQFKVSKPGNVHGPFSNPSTHAMHSTLGITPRYSTYVKSSKLCRSCHTVHLPVFDKDGNKVDDFYEQTTYIEWQNSRYQNEFPVPEGVTQFVQTCQDCHMPGSFPYEGSGENLSFRIANVQNQQYPDAHHLASFDSIVINNRDSFRRHTLLGINQWGLEFFNQFDSILGVRKHDYMTGTREGLKHAIRSGNTLAKRYTARVEIQNAEVKDGKLYARVKVTNLAGHRFPSGVGFRRAFLELKVLDQAGKQRWSSGRTNDQGVILGENGKQLPSEFFEIVNGEESYEPHYDTIRSQNQVQIYQELVKDPQENFTTSFLAIKSIVKDNRLLPIGWTKDGPKDFKHAEETQPHGKAASDRIFTNGTGSDELVYEIANLPAAVLQSGSIQVTLYYQAIPPFYLKDRFTQSKGKNGKRLFYLASHLETRNTNIKEWKLEIAGDRCKVAN